MAAKENKQKSHINIVHRKARFEYEFIDLYVAGMQLQGTEIKSIRENQVNLTDAYCQVHEGEVWVKELHISEYKYGTHYNHEPKRNRKLLLNKREIRKIEKEVQDAGITVVPTRLFVTDKGLAKLEIAVARGKKLHDKREDLKKRDDKREMDRIKKQRF